MQSGDWVEGNTSQWRKGWALEWTLSAQNQYSKVYHQQNSATEYKSHEFRGRNKLVLGHEVADRNFLLEDIKSAKFSIFSVIGSIGLMKAIWLGKWRESVLSQLTCTPINGRHALYNLIRSIRGHRFLTMMRLWLRGPICSLIFAEQDADVAADEGSDVQLTPVLPSILPDEIGLRDKTMLKLQEL